MWIQLQLFKNDPESILGVAVGGNGSFYFRATDIVKLAGLKGDPWKRQRSFLKEAKPISQVVPPNVPITFPKMMVVTLQEMVSAVNELARGTLSRYVERNTNLLGRLVKTFSPGAKVDVLERNLAVFYSTNPTKSATFCVETETNDEDGLATLATVLGRAREKSLHMYARLSGYGPSQVFRTMPTQDRPVYAVDEEDELVIDETRDSTSTVAAPPVFKIHYPLVAPPDVIEWFDGKNTFTFTCARLKRDNVNLHRSENVLENQVVD